MDVVPLLLNSQHHNYDIFYQSLLEYQEISDHFQELKFSLHDTEFDR